jgi:nitrite reductase (NO-forming)
MPRTLWYGILNAIVAAWVIAAVMVMIAWPANAEWLTVHLMLLGAVSTAIIVWSQHFADTLLRRGAPGGRIALGIRVTVHTLGACIVIIGMVSAPWPLVAIGATGVISAAVAQAISISRQLSSALPARFAGLVRYYIVAALFLVIGVAIGVIMANTDAGGDARDRLYFAHIAFNVAGWVGLTVVGTVVLLWPTVLHARILPTADAAARRALPMLAVGVMLVGLACLTGIRIGVSAGLALYLAGLALIAIEAVRQARKSPPHTYAGWSMGAALAWLVSSVLALAVLAAIAPSWADASAFLRVLIIPFVVGFVAQLVAAALSYLLPVVLGRGPVGTRRMNKELDRLWLFRVIIVNGGLLLVLLPVPERVLIALMIVVVSAMLAVIPMAIVAVIVAGRPAAAARPARPAEPAEAAKPAKAAQPAQAANAQQSSFSLHRLSGTVTAALGTLVLVVAVGVAAGSVGGQPIVQPASEPPAAASASSAQPTGETTTVAMTMKNMRFSPSTVRVPAGNTLVIRLTNADQEVHDLTLATGVTSGRLSGGASATVDVGVVTADIDGWCSIVGHRQMGMVMKIEAVGAVSASGTHDQAHHDQMSMGKADVGSGRSAAEDVDLAKKAPSAFHARDAALPPAPASTVHRLTLTVRDTLTAVAQGHQSAVEQTLWTYNGTAPGPTLRGHVGDTFEITLVNDASMGHSIDFHAGSLAPDRPMRTIQPGQSLHYTFTATRSGVWLYHCSTMPMSAHIANGMFGAVIIDPPDLDPVDHEYLLVQSEYYLGAQMGEVDAAKVASKKPDLVVFNGYANQYRDRPLTATAGERVRIWVLDAGPNLPSAFHVVGAQFDTVFSEGDYLLKDGGSTGTGGSQAIALQPAQGGFVELTFPEAGNYPFVTHVMSDAELGASGIFHVSK